MEALKFWIALIGGGLTSAATVIGGDTAVGKCIAIALSLVTAVSVYIARNAGTPAEPKP